MMGSTLGTTGSFVKSEEALHEAAVKETGFDDFGHPSYLEGLRVILAAYDSEARFSPAGRESAYYSLLQFLKTRLRSQQLLNQNPKIRDREIRRPIIITGLVRTGSTALHHLVGQDPGIQVLEYWLAAQPQPRPPRDEWEKHPDFKASVAEIEAMYAADPSLKAIHFMAAEGPEECRHFLAQNFTDDFFEVNMSVPSYTKWYESKHLKDTYERHRDLLKLVGSTGPERRWILKYPAHIKHLRALLEVYPDACIVQTHRDPTRVMSSYISLIAGFRALFEERIDRDEIAREQLEVWASGAEHAIEVRKEHDPSQFFDLYFHDFASDPVGSVKQIYERFGVELSEDRERKLLAHHQSNPQGKHGKHSYSIEGVGVGEAEISERFAAYMKHFGIESEGSH